MDDKMRPPLKDLLHQSCKSFLSISTITNESKLKRRLYGLDPLDALADLSDRSRVGDKRDEKKEKRNDQFFPPFFLLEIFPEIFHNGL
jgi:hypothetical protein